MDVINPSWVHGGVLRLVPGAAAGGSSPAGGVNWGGNKGSPPSLPALVLHKELESWLLWQPDRIAGDPFPSVLFALRLVGFKLCCPSLLAVCLAFSVLARLLATYFFSLKVSVQPQWGAPEFGVQNDLTEPCKASMGQQGGDSVLSEHVSMFPAAVGNKQ